MTHDFTRIMACAVHTVEWKPVHLQIVQNLATKKKLSQLTKPPSFPENPPFFKNKIAYQLQTAVQSFQSVKFETFKLIRQ